MKKQAFSLFEVSIVILVIGLLIVGITKTSVLLSDARLRTAQKITKNSPVGSISDLVLWLETSLDESLTSTTHELAADGDKISSWNDINPQNTKVKLIQTTDASRPTYIEEGINKIPSLSFDGSNDILYSTTSPIVAGSDQYTIIAVWKYYNSSGNKIFIEQKTYGATVTNSGASYFIDASNYFRYSGLGNDTNSNSTLGTLANDTNYIHIMIVNNDDSDGNITVYTNSNTKTQTDSATPSSLNLGAGMFTIGGRATDSSTYSFLTKALVSEIIVYNRALKKSEVIGINDYLSAKYKISIN